MKVKVIVSMLALAAAGSSFAANVVRTTGTATSDAGLVLAVTNTATNQSYDLDLSTTFNTFNGNIANAAYTNAWTVSDTNWTNFIAGVSQSNLVWTVYSGNNKGPISTPGNKALLTTINTALTTADITSGASGGLGAVVGNTDFVAADINAKAGSSLSFIATKNVDDSFFGDGTAGKSGYTFNNNISPTFLAYNAIGATSAFEYITTTGKGKTVNPLAATTFANSFTFNIGANGVASLTYGGVTPSVPEPSSYALSMVALVAMGAVARRRRGA